MKQGFPLFVLVVSALVLVKCKSWDWGESSPLGKVVHPNDNQDDTAKVALGESLFFDTRLSLDETVSCASCHKPGLAFTDGKAVSDGILGRKTARNSPSILNAAYLTSVMYDGELKNLEMQAIVPIQDHNEMGMEMGALIERLRKVPEYQEAARRIFKRDFDPWVLSRSIAAYERTLISDDSDFDLFYYGKKTHKLSKKQQRGWKLFSEKLKCTQCHALPYFTNFKVENNGYTPADAEDKGRFRIHGDSSDIGKFKVPSLRNVDYTGPYMHDGKFETLEEVIDFYAAGGRNVLNQSPLIKPFKITQKEKEELVSFLESLTGNWYK
ncbi:MAG: Cytochrome-c peroxidase [Crocinitomicaceae bacterium]|jgi:cytochrome c peroxidase|nr:Cytochrome-c peroxidase [Crocinitomicaceae bacterium]